MSYCRPAGSSDEDDNDEFEFSTGFDNDSSEYRKKMYLIDKTESKEDLFYSALKNGDSETMKTMLSEGFHVDQTLCGGWSPLMHACSLSLLPLVDILIEAQANVNFNKDGFTPLMALCKSNSRNEHELMKCLNMLLEHGAKVNTSDKNYRTALMYACSSYHIELVKKLVESDCDVNFQDEEYWSALFYAVVEGQEDVVKVLIEKKARLDLTDRKGRTAFDLAIQKGYENIAKLVCPEEEERRRLLKEEENLSIPDSIVQDPVQELFMQFPSINDKGMSGFSSDVSKLLGSMELGFLSRQFATSNVQLNEFLLTSDERQKEVGVKFSKQRQHILDSIRKFHLCQWNKKSLGLKPLSQQMYVLDGVQLMCNVTKHLHILNATMNYVRIYQPIPVGSDVYKMCEKALHQLNLINGELRALHRLATHLKHREKIVAVDLIEPRKRSGSYLVPVLATTFFVGLVLWKSKLSISLQHFKFVT